jgi:xanthine/CO dehydrogenase XdhC/CoxF family maturation factor
LLSFYDAHRAAQSLVLVTVVATEGSTYRKPGALMLIGADGSYQGMVSGGCLERDLALRAREVFESGEPQRFTYDLRDDEQQPWGLGLGCEGVIHLLLRRLDRERQFGFLPFLKRSLEERHACSLSLAVGAGHPSVPLGLFAIRNAAGETQAEHEGLLAGLAGAGNGQQRARAVARRIPVSGQAVEVLHIQIHPTPRVLICGAGPDAQPLAEQVTSLGWECWVVDHRPAFADAGRFPRATAILQSDPAELSGQIALGEISAAVVMSHNLKHDEDYLRQLLPAGVPYVGLLGPAARRRRLLERVGGEYAAVHGPAGLDIGAELPESIALSIMAEIHAVLNARDGGSLAVDGG